MAEIIRCPHCMTTVYQDAQYCHSCSGRLKRRSRRIFTKGAITFILVGVTVFGILDALDLLLNRRAIQRRHASTLQQIVTNLAAERQDRVRRSLSALSPEDFEDALCGAVPLVKGMKESNHLAASVTDLGYDPLPFEKNTRRYLLTVTVANSALSYKTYVADAWFRYNRQESKPVAFRWRESREFTEDSTQASHR